MARVLVTGGAGFLGSHLVERLVVGGHDVICLDNCFTGDRKNLAGLLESHSSFEFIRHDVIEPILLEVEQIFHLACPASPVHYRQNPVKTIKTNVMGTLNMLGLAKRVRARILLASTSEVYGDPLESPQKESYRGNVNQIGPRACYDEGKRVAETLMMDYHRQNRVDTRIARIFNTYGPRMSFDDGRVVSNFILQALRNEPLTIYGDGNQTRSFCYVSDLIDGLLALMEFDGDECHLPVNLGNPTEITVRDLAEKIINIAGSSSTLATGDLPEDDPVHRCPDLTRARDLLGYEPKVDIDEGLKRTLQDFRNRL